MRPVDVMACTGGGGGGGGGLSCMYSTLFSPLARAALTDRRHRLAAWLARLACVDLGLVFVSSFPFVLFVVQSPNPAKPFLSCLFVVVTFFVFFPPSPFFCFLSP